MQINEEILLQGLQELYKGLGLILGSFATKKAEEPTMEHLQRAANAIFIKNPESTEKVKTILKKYGAVKLSELDKKFYRDFLEDLALLQKNGSH